jgi:dolichol-phosphate mannosyltransferase
VASISIILAVHNQESSLKELAKQLEKAASGLTRHNFEFIYVDNGSLDGSYAVLRDFASSDRRVRVVRLTRNFGRSGALQAGITYSSGDCAVFLEAFPGFATDFLPEMVSLWESGVRVVTTVYQAGDTRRGSQRQLRERLKRTVQNLLFKDLRPTPGTPFLIDRQAADLILRAGATAIPFQAILAWAAFKSAVLTLPASAFGGTTAPVSWRETLAEWSAGQYGLSHWPVRLAGRIAFTAAATSLIAMLGILGILLLKPTTHIEAGLVWAALFLAVAAQLIGTGLLGKYLQRTVEFSRGWPAFIVESVINEPAVNQEAREKIEKLLSSFAGGARRRRSGEQ